MVGIERYIDDKGVLRDAVRAVADERKFSDYALSKESPRGRNKAFVFERVLGYTHENADELRRQVLDGVQKYRAVMKDKDAFGQKFEVFMPASGPKGRAVVKTAWIYDENDELRLTSLMVADEKEQELYKYLLEEE